MRIAKVVLILSLLSSFAATQALATDYTVHMSGDYSVMFFDPSSLTITAGDRVRWQNVTGLQHTATSGTECLADHAWQTGIMDPGQTSAYITFNTVGDFGYFCKFHCEMGMIGSVTVKAVPIPVKPTTWGGVKALFAAIVTAR
jgi:plastocyanin